MLKRASRICCTMAAPLFLLAAPLFLLAASPPLAAEELRPITITTTSLAAPANTSPPAIHGEALEGRILTATSGAWSGKPTSYTYKWASCDSEGCAPLSPEAQRENAYQLGEADVGRMLQVQVTARNAAGSATATSSATPAVDAHGGAVVGWGDNKFGELGTIYQDSAEVNPVDAVEGLGDVTQIGGGLALLANGTVAARGGGFRGELGDDGDEASWEEGKPYVMVNARENPATHKGEGLLEGVREVAGAAEHRLALLEDGEVMAWGNNEYGQLGQGPEAHGFEKETAINQRLPKAVLWIDPATGRKEQLDQITAIAAGGGSDYALTSEGTVLAWGDDAGGQLGIDEPERCETEGSGRAGKTEACSAVPKPVMWTNPETDASESLKEVKAIHAGHFAAYALLTDGRVVSWGENNRGQLGTGLDVAHGKREPPAYVVTSAGESRAGKAETSQLEHVAEVAAGYDDAFARLENGEVYGWGSAEMEVLPGLTASNCARELQPKQRQEKEKLIATEEAEIRELEAEIKAREDEGESAEALEEALHEAEQSLQALPDRPCVKVATPDGELDRDLDTKGAKVEALAAGNGVGAALSGGKVYVWGSNERGQQGNGKFPAGKWNPKTGKREREKGYPVAEVRGIGAAKAISAGSDVMVLLESEVPPPPPLIRVVPGKLSLSLYWQKATADGAEKLEAEGLRYRRREPGEFHPVENAEAEAPEEGEEQTGPPQEGEEPPAITVAGGEPVEGEPVAAGEKLEAHAGKWTGAGHLLYKYQWQRCSAGCESESSWQLIKGARKARYTLTQEDVGCSIRFLVTVTGREEPAMTVPSSQLTEIVEGAGEAEEAKETTHVNFSKDRPEEIEPEEIFAYRIGSTRNGARLEAEPYAVVFTTDGKHTESDLGKGRTRRMVLTPAG